METMAQVPQQELGAWPSFPERFGSVEDSRAVCADFFGWYNVEHHHSGLGLLTPYDVHHGLAQARIHARAATLAEALRARPDRFPHGPPAPPALPAEAWINKPKLLVAAASTDLAKGGGQTTRVDR
jgi:putative transposase